VERELRALDVHPTNLHQLQDAILSIWANISKECINFHKVSKHSFKSNNRYRQIKT